jgi:hypothetical protein
VSSPLSSATPTSLQRIQQVLGVVPDGKWGPVSQAALEREIRSQKSEISSARHGKASSFADPSDIAAFHRCKALGKTDQECFKVGDNGIGCWGDNVAQGSGEAVALPPETMEETWGSVDAARNRSVIVTANGRNVVARVRDRMPHRHNITNGAIIDLNPDTAAALALKPPFMVDASWEPA